MLTNWITSSPYLKTETEEGQEKSKESQTWPTPHGTFVDREDNCRYVYNRACERLQPNSLQSSGSFHGRTVSTCTNALVQKPFQHNYIIYTYIIHLCCTFSQIYGTDRASRVGLGGQAYLDINNA